MAKAVAARLQGDEYQGRFFWIQVCRLFEDRTKVIKVELESSKIKSLDDVVVYYEGMFDFDEPIAADYFQVKFHVTAKGAFTWKGLMDPDFINARSVSLLQRLYDAQLKIAPAGRGCRFIIYSPWSVHPDDELAEILDQTEGRIRWSTLSEAGAKSKLGKVREAWRIHLELKSDEDLQVVLAPIRIRRGPTLVELDEELNLHLQIAGLKPIQAGAILNPYDDLARKFIQRGRISFTRKDIEDICRSEGLWVGKTIAEPEAVRLGIRSFWKFAESLEDETDATLCLLRHFDGRIPKDQSVWREKIASEVQQFLRKNTSPGRAYHIRLQTHGTIAFLAGWELYPKSGVDIVPVQDSSVGRQIWRPGTISADTEKRYDQWQISTNNLESVDASEIIIAISVAHDIERDVLAYAQQNLQKAGFLIHFRLASIGPLSVSDGTHAQLLAQNLVKSIRELRQEQHLTGLLHVFVAAPNGLTFLFGRLAHVLGQIVLYEFDFEADRIGAYSPSMSFRP